MVNGIHGRLIDQHHYMIQFSAGQEYKEENIEPRIGIGCFAVEIVQFLNFFETEVRHNNQQANEDVVENEPRGGSIIKQKIISFNDDLFLIIYQVSHHSNNSGKTEKRFGSSIIFLSPHQLWPKQEQHIVTSDNNVLRF